jgi:hypothetical protein
MSSGIWQTPSSDREAFKWSMREAKALLKDKLASTGAIVVVKESQHAKEVKAAQMRIELSQGLHENVERAFLPYT